MFSECEHACLLRMALACKQRGLNQIEARKAIETDLGGISTGFRIAQAVETAFSPGSRPDLI